MGSYVVTDLTRFRNPDIVCIAMVDMESGQCFRPMPYLKSREVRRLNIHPGAILRGNLALKEDLDYPHIEDATFTKRRYAGKVDRSMFRSILERTLSDSVEGGFGVTIDRGQKHINHGQPATCSIITIKVPPKRLSIEPDRFDPEKIRASFTDGAGFLYRYLSITDRGFFDFAKKHQDDGQLDKASRFVRSQQEVYLRVGLSRRYSPQDDERDGYWLQVNGIYTFPDYLEEVRQY